MSAATQAPPRPRVERVRLSRDAIAVGAWIAVVAVGAAAGQILRANGTEVFLGAPPLLGAFEIRLTPGVVVAVAVAAAIALRGPVLAMRLSWRRALALSALAAAAWPVALALTAGGHTITQPLTSDHEYLTVIPLIHSPGDFLRTFLDRIDLYATHIRGHPPGMALILYGLARAGLGGPGPEAALIIAIASTTPVAVALAARSLAGERAARLALPFIVLAPAALWIASSADALYMGVGAWAVALLILALRNTGVRSGALALGGGLLFGLTCFLSFGLVLLGLIPLAVAVAERRVAPLAIAAVGGAIVAAAFLAGGYWWFDGFSAVREQYAASVARSRPYSFFVFNNLSAFALALGPAAAIALGRLRDRRLWLLVGSAACAVLAADLSGMSKGEVERIWLPFLPWILVAAAALPERIRTRRALLGAQAAVAIAVEITVATAW